MTNEISVDGAVRQSHKDGGEDRLLRARVHLLAADGLLTEPCLYRPREYFTVCGQVITNMDLPHAFCPNDECDCELRYCPTCIQYATRWNAELGEEMPAPRGTMGVGFDGEIDAPGGAIVRLSSSSAPGGAPAPRRL